MFIKQVVLLFLIALAANNTISGQTGTGRNAVAVNVDNGWAGNSVNTVVFRKNSLVTYKNIQFISYYDADGFVVIGKRNLNNINWELKKTVYKGNITDAHNSISIMVDSDGFLHIAWDHHNNPLRYCKSKEPLSLELKDIMPMTGDSEKNVTYPEFYKMPDGNLLFLYRDGSSGNGNLIINMYHTKEKRWNRLQSNLIDGEKKRNAYWQACVDGKGFIHISWVWRESPDVASNHDMCYAVSKDGGVSWQKSTGEQYQLPITLSSAEKICTIAQNNELINQTSMCTDKAGNPYIASYWKGINNIPQYHIIYRKGNSWKVKDMGFRKTAFSLNGKGTKQIPISRPQIICRGIGKNTIAGIVFRDEERGNKVSLASNKVFKNNKWQISDVWPGDMGAWEPTYDTELWKEKKQLHLFIQRNLQADAEGVTKTAPQMIQVLECKF